MGQRGVQSCRHRNDGTGTPFSLPPLLNSFFDSIDPSRTSTQVKLAAFRPMLLIIPLFVIGTGQFATGGRVERRLAPVSAASRWLQSPHGSDGVGQSD
jgi:hypothetical protein